MEKRLDEAERAGGLYYKELKPGSKQFMAFDANGHVVKNAPPRPDDTPRGHQAGVPNAAHALNPATPAIDYDRLGHAIGRGLASASVQRGMDSEAEQAANQREEAVAASGMDTGVKTGGQTNAGSGTGSESSADTSGAAAPEQH